MQSAPDSPLMRRDAVAEMVTEALRRITHAVDLRSRDLIARCGLTGPQLTLMKELANTEHLSVGRLTQAMHLSQATVTGILDRLERRGLIRRVRSAQDKRRVDVCLTDNGRELLDRAPPLLHEEFIAQFSELQDWERTQMLSSLQRLVAMMEGGRPRQPKRSVRKAATPVEETRASG